MADSGLAAILGARENTYDLLSCLYRSEVTADFLQKLFAGLGYRPAAGDGYTLLGKFAESVLNSDLCALEERLAAEYACLFLNAGNPPHVFPYESVYTSADGLLMQEARDRALSAYRAEGLEKAGDFKEPEDHIAVELAFMARLCRNAAEALEAGNREVVCAHMAKQRSFLETHLLNWVPRFCDDLEQAARSDFYRAVAQITRQFLEIEPETLDEIARTDC